MQTPDEVGEMYDRATEALRSQLYDNELDDDDIEFEKELAERAAEENEKEDP